MALAAEYDEMLDSCNQKIDLANRDLMTRGQEIERLSEQVEALTRERNDLQAAITQQQQLQQQQQEAATDKELAELKAQLVALQASSSRTIANLQTKLKKSNDESASLSASSTSSKVTADKQVEALTAQGKKDADEIAALKKRIAEVEAAKVLADRSIADLTAVHVPCATEIASLKKKIAELEATAAAVSDVKKNVLPSQTSANEGRGTRDDSDLARQIVELTKTNEQLQTHLVNLAKEFQSYKETSIASMAGSEEKAAQHIAQLQKERDTLAIKLGLASKDVNKAAASPSGNVPPLPPVPVAHSSSTPSTGKPDESEQARALVSLTNEYHVYKYTAENDLAVAQDTAASLRRANQLLQNEIDQLTEDFGAYKKMSEETIADIESLHAARYLRHFLLIHFLHL